MKIAILETGQPSDTLAEEFGDYPAMFASMLGEKFEVETFDVPSGELPVDPDTHTACLITGSPAGVYEELPWIRPLEEFIRAAKMSRLVGICFGHQIIAKALGGQVEKSEKGWGAGLHRYTIVRQEPWMDGEKVVAVPASHQDQVVVQPPNTTVVATSDFTPFAALSWLDRAAISFQFHPEFAPRFAKALIAKRFDIVPDPAAAMASLDAPNDNERVAGWIRRFLAA
ncbi:MAG TPA: type 1 glutamine amidotransferase [Sphingomicrobium sp.]|nr:type 1 glutamine amidotransferase [Sphingomicrobium sp.]